MSLHRSDLALSFRKQNNLDAAMFLPSVAILHWARMNGRLSKEALYTESILSGIYGPITAIILTSLFLDFPNFMPYPRRNGIER